MKSKIVATTAANRRDPIVLWNIMVYDFLRHKCARSFPVSEPKQMCACATNSSIVSLMTCSRSLSYFPTYLCRRSTVCVPMPGLHQLWRQQLVSLMPEFIPLLRLFSVFSCHIEHIEHIEERIEHIGRKVSDGRFYRRLRAQGEITST
jgi:hypothetical protein